MFLMQMGGDTPEDKHPERYLLTAAEKTVKSIFRVIHFG
jgi:hypothetical protein